MSLLLALAWQGESFAAVRTCERMILVAPAPMSDLKLSGWLMQQAKAAFMRSKKWNCAPFYGEDVSSEIFDFLGLEARDPGTIQTRQLEFIKERTDADQLMFLTFDAAESVLKLQIFDLCEDDDGLKFIVDGEFEVDIDPASVAQNRSGLLRLVLPYLTPNAFSLGISSVKAVVDRAAGYEEIYTVNRSTLPAFISSIQISKIDHPDSFGLFDISFSIFPGFFFFAIDQYTEVGTLDPSVRESPRNLHMQAIGSNANLNGEVTLHTPIGSTYMSVGGGPSYYAQKQDSEGAKVIFSEFDLRVRFGHRAFVTKNLFFSLDADQVYLTEKLYYVEGVAKSDHLIRVSASIGWYFPTSSLYY